VSVAVATTLPIVEASSRAGLYTASAPAALRGDKSLELVDP
jgi:hypothetical protein